MLLNITDDFDLDKIINCGQCFRASKDGDGRFHFICREHVLSIRRISDEVFETDTDEDTWDAVWRRYFDLERSYKLIRQGIKPSDPFMKKAARDGIGIRILRQDPWEMLISFIISQRKSIPAIKQSIEAISERWGTPVNTAAGTVFLFPTAIQLANVAEDEFKTCKVGYRASYLCHAVRAVLDNKPDLQKLYAADYQEIMDALMEINGVGVKVANCIALFAYGRTSAAPVDTWIKKIIDIQYSGINPFPGYKDSAGIMQQYAFYYALTHKEEFRND